jgi:hypothetical protein
MSHQHALRPEPVLSYKDVITKVFDRLYAVSWPVFFPKDPKKRDFWHTANTLDTCVDFIIEGSKYWDLSDQRTTVQGMIQDSHDYFGDVYKDQNQPGKDSPKVWWDDYGWWGITFTKIHQNFTAIFQGSNPRITKEDCLQLARTCWSTLGGYSEKINRSVQPPQKGPVEGGCWNHPPADEGIQNTVTNGLYLVLSARLFRSSNEKDVLQAAAAQYLWFRNWFVNYFEKQKECPLPGKQQGLFRCLERSGDAKFILVYERAIDPANPDYNQGNPPFFDGQLWTGDQGLLLGGLAAILDIQEQLRTVDIIKQEDPTFPENATKMALWVANGISWLFDPLSVLHEAPLNSKFGTDFAADMATGKGVMMRYLDYAMNRIGLNARTYIIKSAAAVVAGKNDAYDLNFQWDDRTDSRIGTNESEVEKTDPRFQPTVQSAGLDALNAAIQYLRE